MVNMASPSALEVSKLVNSISNYSSEDQQGIATVTEDYFTSRDDCAEEFELDCGKCMYYLIVDIKKYSNNLI